MQKKKMVCLIGIDGVGKTAHTYKLLYDLQESRERCKHVWLGSPHFFSFPFMAFCRLLGFTSTHNFLGEGTCSEHQYYKNRAIALMWPWIQLIDLVIFVTLRIYIPLWRGVTIVCDRFIHDILVEIMTGINDSQLHKKLVGRLMLRLKPRCAMILLLDIREETALQRKQDIPNLRYLARRRSNYQLIADRLRIPIIDTERSFIAVHEDIIKRVGADE